MASARVRAATVMTGDDDPLLNLRPSFRAYFVFENAAAFKHLTDAVAPVQGALREIFISVLANNNTLCRGWNLLKILGWDGHARPDDTDPLRLAFPPVLGYRLPGTVFPFGA